MITKKIVEPKRELGVLGEWDVIVVGGGTAGVVAALASARTGAKTVLIEKYGFLGGTIHGGVCSWHNFFNVARVHGKEPIQLVKGIPAELVERLVQRGQSVGHIMSDTPNIAADYITIVDREAYKQLAVEMMQEEHVTLLFHTSFVDVVQEEDQPIGVIVESKNGREAILGKRIIDTSGDGDVAHRSGCEMVGELEPYTVGRVFGMANVKLERLADFLREHKTLGLLYKGNKNSDKDDIAKIFWYFGNDPRFKDFATKTGLRLLSLNSVHENELTYINGIHAAGLKDLSIAEKTRAEVQTLDSIHKVAKELKKSIPGFEDAYISWMSPQAGIRRSRVVACEYDLTSEEVDNCARFDDEIGLYGYHDWPTKHTVGKGGWYGIPYRAILPKKVDNLLVAGRMITSDKGAHMSTRNSVSCMLQAQAAGTAAALSIQHNVTPRDLDVSLLRKQLQNDGVLLDL